MTEKLFLSWEDIHQDSLLLANKLKAKQKKWSSLVAIARGGLSPALILSHELDIRHIDTVCLHSYDDETLVQGELKVLKQYENHSDDILVVDDLVDTGSTVKTIRTMIPNADFSSVYAKPLGQATIDVYAKDLDQDVWVVFPWEKS